VDLGRFLIETHLRTGRSIKELAAAHDVSPRWLFTLLRRYRLEGPAGIARSAISPRTNSTIYMQHPSSRPLCLKKWSTEWGSPQLVGLAGIEPATEGL
jgi:hypothetical protein